MILLDRYTTSSFTYQASVIEDLEERKKFIDFVIDFEYNKLGIKKPDSVIFLTAPFDAITELRNKRISNDGIENDIREKDFEFLKTVYDNSVFIADYLSWDKIECSDGEKIKTIDEIHQNIYSKVKEILKY